MLPDLIRRVDALAGPDRAVDAEIAAIVRWMPENAPGWLKRWGGPFAPFPEFIHPGQVVALHNDGQRGVNWSSPAFTASIDAALTLIHLPGHPLWTLRTETGSHGRHGMTYSAELCVPSREFMGYSRANLACAIAAAALRARMECQLPQPAGG